MNTVASGKQPAVYVTYHVNCLALKIKLNTGSDNFGFGSSVWTQLGLHPLEIKPLFSAYGGYSLLLL